MTVKAIIFDLDNTIYDFMDCHERALDAVADYAYRHFGMEKDVFTEKSRIAMRHTEEKIGEENAAIHSRTLRYQTLLEECGESAIEHAYPMRNVYWDTFYEQMVLPPVVKRVLEELRKRDLKILVATDMTCDVQLEKIRTLGIGPYLDFLVTSEEAGAEKPGDRILDLCVKKAGVPKEACVFIGDHPRKDVAGPIAYGMQGVWCRHFNPQRFLKGFDIVVDEEESKRLPYQFSDYESCFDEAGNLTNLGGLKF